MMTISARKSRSTRILTTTKIKPVRGRAGSWRHDRRHGPVVTLLTGLFILRPVAAQPSPASDLAVQLASGRSASIILNAKCARLAPGQSLRSVALDTASPPQILDIRRRLKVTRLDALKLRHVSIKCGEIELSNAWNWYVPSRLSAEMNKLLDTTETPFGLAVKSLAFTRRVEHGFAPTPPPGMILQQRALLLRGRDHMPFAFVLENYTENNQRPSEVTRTYKTR